MDVPAGVTQEEGHTGFLHLPSAVLALFFFREKDSAVPFPLRPRSRNLRTHELIVLHLLGMLCFVRKNPNVPLFSHTHYILVSYVADMCDGESIIMCMYAYIYDHTYTGSKSSVDQPGKVANPARGQLDREKEYFPVHVRA